MNYLISAIILNYRCANFTVKCVQALQKQSINDQLEIIVVDNHSEDDSIGIIRNRLSDVPNVRIVETPKNGGFGYGNNYGARYASGEYILIMNPDNELEPHGLEQLIAQLQNDESIGIIAPKLVFNDGKVRSSAPNFPSFFDPIIKRTFLNRLFPKRMDTFLKRNEETEEMRESDWLHGAFLLMKRDLYEQLGGFDERFFLFLEDTDLCKRCWNAGKRVVYYPNVVAKDREQRLSGTNFRSLLLKKTGRIHLLSGIKFFWKHGLNVRPVADFK